MLGGSTYSEVASLTRSSSLCGGISGTPPSCSSTAASTCTAAASLACRFAVAVAVVLMRPQRL
ncbi:hypothetical protein DIPPA_16793 [Diplonema papillatum]|nr:hypothetical protein DIPPA_16793 [Diplonema papillatum]